SDSGYIHVGWSSDAGYMGYQNGSLRSYNDTIWGSVEIVLPTGAIYWHAFYVEDIVSTGIEKPKTCSYQEWNSIMGTAGSNITVGYFNEASQQWWWNSEICQWSYPIRSSVGLRCMPDGKTMVCYEDYYDSNRLKCSILTGDTLNIETTLLISDISSYQAGRISKTGRPCIVWSDSQRIYASAFYDTMWSTTPTLISDSSLTNCINPDVVVENDSTMWVCYESNNEIYVTKTSIPLGITGGRPEQNKITLKPFIHAYPNPASNKVNISYNNNGPAVISIYDITGGQIRSLTASNGQAVWDCRNGQGQQVSSGVYFIRARQNNNEIIKKINIVR
ncbi:MAG: T9SS type A sorting domain-containing protein, partial [bacterium]|nr:T9SS type A sorting domain-containing protein [bacterium]